MGQFAEKLTQLLVRFWGIRSRGPASPGKNGRLLVRMSGKVEKGVQIGSPVQGHAVFSSRQAKALAAGNVYVVLDSTDHPNGELRGQLRVPKS